MSNVNPLEAAAAPSFIIALQALQEFIKNLGPDPLKVPLTLPGALAVLTGKLSLQFPVLVSSEFVTVQTKAVSDIDGWIASLQKIAPPAS